MTELGTWRRAQRTGGVITASDRDELDSRLGAVFEAAARLAPVPPLDRSIIELMAPDSALCREATDLWQTVAQDWLHGHGHCTWYYARALADIDRLDADLEHAALSGCVCDADRRHRTAPPTPSNRTRRGNRATTPTRKLRPQSR